MMWGWQGWSWWGWLLMTFSIVAFWGLVIWAVVALFRSPDATRSNRLHQWRFGRPDPQRVLAERFARGEIDEDEYLRRLDTLHPASHDSNLQ